MSPFLLFCLGLLGRDVHIVSVLVIYCCYKQARLEIFPVSWKIPRMFVIEIFSKYFIYKAK